jgi:hypothetical protein
MFLLITKEKSLRQPENPLRASGFASRTHFEAATPESEREFITLALYVSSILEFNDFIIKMQRRHCAVCYLRECAIDCDRCFKYIIIFCNARAWSH